jgi:ion channel POLLUX/CASTOR
VVAGRPRFSLSERLRYRFDNTLARGAFGLIAWLGVASVALITGSAVVIALVGIRGNEGEKLSFVEGFWQSLVRTLDPGTMGGDVGWPWRLAALTVTIGGVLVVAALIGVVTTGLDSRLRELSRGRGRIAEAGHTLILGWSPKAPTILRELAIANQNQPRSCVVVLAATEKSVMDAEVRERTGPTGRTRVITRSGEPYEHGDITLVNPQLAKAVVVLRHEDDHTDANVVKTVLALLYDVKVGPEVSLVAEVADAGAAAALRAATEGRVAVLEPGSIIARATAQTCLVPGLNLVLEELLDFNGSEIYFADVPALAGITFGDALHGFEESIPIGIRRQDGSVVVHPPMETRFAPGDQVVAVAEDDDTIRFVGARATPSLPVPVDDGVSVPRSRRIVMFGFSDFSAPFVRELDGYVAPGSVLTAVLDRGLVTDAEAKLPTDLENVQVVVREVTGTADPVREILTAEPCDHVVIFCYRSGLGASEADARALMSFLGARQTLEELGADANVVVEVLDVRDVALVPAASADEFVVSERLTSLLMAQLAENADLAPVLNGMLDAAGSELYCKPVERYCDPATPVTFAQIVEAARRRGEIALGYRLIRDRGVAARRFGVTLNPPRSRALQLEPGDLVITLAEDAQ